MIFDTALVWSAIALVFVMVVGIFLIFAYRRIRRLEVEVKRIVTELSKLEE